MGGLAPAALGLADHAALRHEATASAPGSIRGKTPAEEQQRFFEHLAGIFREEGADAWYARPAADFLPAGADLRGFAREDFQAETDILDVWFDSGVSHIAVLRSGAWPELVKSGSAPLRARIARPTSTSRGTTSIAAGSSRRF